MNADDRDRRAIRDAMRRLLDGKPIRSPGDLTVSDLATESGVMRWKFYQRYPDLRDEFLAQAAAQDHTPAAAVALMKENAELTDLHEKDRAKVQLAAADIKRLACVVQVLALENAQLEERLTSTDHRVVELARRVDSARSR